MKGPIARALLVALLALAPHPEAARAQSRDANPHGELAIPCATCHTADAWRPAKIQPTFDHAKFGFPLEDGHAPVSCTACHTSLEFNRVPETCAACHRDVHRGELGVECAQCHNTRAFGDRSEQLRAHGLTRFPLDGAHRAVDCRNCHASTGEGKLSFRGAPTDCFSCHREAFEQTATPNHPAAQFSTDCTECHTNVAWKGATFDHSTTKFPLTGGHQAATCDQCHADKVYVGKPTVCVACHQANYDLTQTPPHPAAKFPTDCTGCHTTATWAGAPFDHNTTLFPLTGAHRAATCEQCHADKVYVGKSTTCISCHQPQYDQTKAPPHQAAGFPADCTVCHNTTKWLGAVFNHQTTDFPLTGAHQAATCQSCHADGVYNGKPTTCVSCHQSQYNQTRTPPHQAAGFPTDCTVCHNTTKWLGAVFDHQVTSFPLTGAHQAATCQSCHADGVYNGKPTTCVSCHQGDYNTTANPKHQAAGFSTTCTNCHTTATWAGAVFDHQKTQFPLTGAHLATNCQQCHGDGVYNGKPTTCVSCHQTDYNGTANPPHQAAGFPTTCTICHTTVTWTGGAFDHQKTQFPLTGAHLAATCQQCHGDGVYAGKPTTCVSCHQTDYNGTANPPHQAAGFPTTCTTCHTTTTWTGAVFDHQKTLFPLTGAHLAATCQQCHGDGVYKGKPTACVSCHQTDYNGTANPPHQPAGFATTCSSCHTTVTWVGGTFNHNATQFPLTGKHVTTPCMQCHSDLVFKGKPTTCVSCHLTDYNGTTNPNHQAAGFPTNCVSCHTTATWLGATFNHDAQFFPIYSGKHRGQWNNNCATCHTNPANYVVFTCLNCHEHAKTKTDNQHTNVAGYQYTSQACYSCHPRGTP